MENFIQQLINGLSLGSIYALIALGYTMVYGIIKLINFAHGEVYMVGSYVGYTVIRNFNLGLIPALLFSMVFCAILGVVVERVAYKPLRKATRVAALITAIGVSFLLQYIVLFIMGPEVKAFPETLQNKSYSLGGITIDEQQITIFVVTIVLMLALQFIVKKTKMGKAMRAVSVDADAAKLMGINVDNTISFTFALGSALAGAAGVLVGIYYNSISPMMGTAPGLKAFIAAVLGGIGLIPGAMFGGFTIGIIETLISGYGNSMIKDAVVYGILIVILIVKPSGLLGKNTKEKV
ncbi:MULTISPECIES: branched-chain amino acid ABC transporter permease [Carnobacterium]|jgi:branched-chain amino acid transport system permease protein|uniref:Branched-chain amino acid transport system / permease component family protein n=2 Tax=Carnobacterium maltaromaticum TaxID=2751 RepID=K8EES0_CARML|nr:MULTISPECIES: branched-chain amino acid ABC transporter permease [Carnobacterium]AOA01275.1 ABC transporter permease [Carnobacterium maltaromaticum]KRN62938.1 high-affinity branched-chain amino acid transport system permease [Carnobacterium maltaromaticum DSM 20342]KRN73686.1 high-affinity branched-chain amino acid transport system permease [Carnobacterium maltaromaticum]KRN85005.1 high-affinity branched-chain amino acid transport system permease [Carnobacterium maltaromaticum]MBC9789889.1 